MQCRRRLRRIAASPVPAAEQSVLEEVSALKIRIQFAKYGKMIYIGHLDIMRYFQKALRRADVDLAYTQGYNPHPILSFAAPLGVGITSCGEYADLEVNSSGSSKEMLARLNEVMVPGMRLLTIVYYQMMLKTR